MAQKTRTGVAAAKTRLEFDVGTYLESAGPARKVLKYRAGQTVFSQGEPANDIKYLQKGAIKLSVLSQIGKEAVVAMLGPGDFFGEGALAGQPLRIGTATAITATQRPDASRRTPMIRLLPRRADVFGSVPHAHAHAQHPHRSRPRRSAVQLERKAARPDAAAAGALRRDEPAARRCRRSRRRRWRRWSARRARA